MFSKRINEFRAAVADRVVSQGWLETMLRKHYMAEDESANVEISSISIRNDYELIESVLSDIIALTVEANVNDERKVLHVMIKLLPRDSFTRNFVAKSQFDLREITFYTKIAPELKEFQKNVIPDNAQRIKLPIPKCYFAKYLPAESSSNSSTTTIYAKDSVIILEDLKQDGYQNASFIQGLSLKQVESAFEAVSRVHALSLAIKVKEQAPLNQRYDFLFQTGKASDSYQQLIDRGMPQLTKFLEKQSYMQEIIECLTTLKPNTKQLVEALLAPEEPISLITHTDFWCNNLLFKDDHCIILDWQMVTYSQPTNDLALLLMSSVPTNIRREHTIALLDFYWQNLIQYTTQLGLDIENELGYNRDRLGQDYKRSQLLSLLLCIGSVDVAFGNQETEQRLVDVLIDLYRDGILSSDFIRVHQLKV